MRQFDKTHAITLVAAVALEQYRFVSYAGGVPVASGAGGATDVAGVTEFAAAAGDRCGGRGGERCDWLQLPGRNRRGHHRRPVCEARGEWCRGGGLDHRQLRPRAHHGRLGRAV